LIKKEKDQFKNMIVLENELSLLKFAEEANKDKYTYLQDELNFFLVKFALSGPCGTPYETGLFQVNMEVPKNYPNESPKICFMTKIWHPYVHFETGIFKHPMLNKKWKPSFSLVNLIDLVINILSQPEINQFDSVNAVACREFSENKKFFLIKARGYTNDFAKDQVLRQNPDLPQNIMSVEIRRSLLKNNLLGSVVSENNKKKEMFKIVKENKVADSNKFSNKQANNAKSDFEPLKNLNFERKTKCAKKHQKVNLYVKTNNQFDESADEINEGIDSETIENSKFDRNEALEKEEFQRVRSPEILELYGNYVDLNIINLKNENEKGFHDYNGNNRVYINYDDFEGAENFEIKEDNHINIINKIKRNTTELTGNGSLEKRNHSNYEVDFDSKKDINLSENNE